MTGRGLTMPLRIAHAADVSPDVRVIVLRACDGNGLPSFAAGSHVALSCGGRVNAYSLTNDGHNPDHYAISVGRRDGGRGGSVWLHNVPVGTVVDCSAPRCDFGPVRIARRHLLVSAGIGLTPFLSYLRAARRWGYAMQMLHVAPDGAIVPHLEDLHCLAGPGGFQLARGRGAFVAALDIALREQPMGTHLYVCGPAGFMDDVLARAQAAGWPQARCHIERFGAAPMAGGQAFTAVLARSGRVVEVAADTSLLDALEQAGVSWPALCRNGVCGECRMEGAAGEITHHDFVLTEAERASGTCLLPCVSRATGRLELDL
ncbi:MAG: PDR/VanB family oxidoreductase [Acetobacter sp.]|uniref:PDR/VanB family oxidoreductase n=2 Tax=Acetobacter sp. TaxID=440 RepID=UPI0039E744D2